MDELTKDQKQIIAKVGLDLNISAQKIANVLGVDRSTIYRYSEKATPEEMQQFETEIETYMNLRKQEILAKALIKIEKLIDEEWDIRYLIPAYKVLYESQNNKSMKY